jgi:L-ascorbate metabolism protein UlaG (beta-lactamase superfamily)
LAQAQFSDQRFDSVAFCKAIRGGDATSIPEGSRRRNLHYLDWARVISDSNARGQHLDRPDLVEMAQGDQTTKAARVRNSSSAFHRLRPGDACALRSPRSRHVAANQPIVVPTGVGNLVHDLGFHIVHELDYWQTVELGPVKISLTPCHHWGARFLADSHRDFGGFVVATNGRTIFHCGDTAYFPGFREIGDRFNVQLALLPIGAYDAPTGREVHMNPEQAVKAFIELRANTLIPMHYGSFRLGFEPLHEPPQRLLAAARRHGIEEKVLLMTEGKPVVL